MKSTCRWKFNKNKKTGGINHAKDDASSKISYNWLDIWGFM